MESVCVCVLTARTQNSCRTDDTLSAFTILINLQHTVCVQASECVCVCVCVCVYMRVRASTVEALPTRKNCLDNVNSSSKETLEPAAAETAQRRTHANSTERLHNFCLNLTTLSNLHHEWPRAIWA
jgi:hypothetical protein